MPIFEPGDAPTSTWGGTMIGIPRNCEKPKASWKLIEFLYFSDAGIAARRKYSTILPPVITAWDDPIYQRGDPYFGGQQVDQLFIELAKELPARYVTPATSTAGVGADQGRDRRGGFVENAAATTLPARRPVPHVAGAGRGRRPAAHRPREVRRMNRQSATAEVPRHPRTA